MQQANQGRFKIISYLEIQTKANCWLLRLLFLVVVVVVVVVAVAYPGIFFVGGFQQIQLRTEERENGDLGAVAP